MEEIVLKAISSWNEMTLGWPLIAVVALYTVFVFSVLWLSVFVYTYKEHPNTTKASRITFYLICFNSCLQLLRLFFGVDHYVIITTSVLTTLVIFAHAFLMLVRFIVVATYGMYAQIKKDYKWIYSGIMKKLY
jgi:hypothetical protein